MVEIILKNVSLDYPVLGHNPKFSKRVLSLASAGRISSGTKKQYVRSIDKLNLHLKPGDKLAVIGGNGAGKTSLLKLIAGIYDQSSGEKSVVGRVTTILGTGFGLDEEATGYQNIFLGGIALGYSYKEMEACFKDIEEFTDLGDFLNLPLRVFSAGMKARLAFAIATCKHPDILIIDEGVGTGDKAFLERAEMRLTEFLSKANILLMASHSNDLLRKFCNKCLLMNNGKAVYFGDLEKGIELYEEQAK